MSNLYDPESVGEILGVSTVTLFHWRKNGIGPEWFRRGQFYYYRAEQLQAYLDKIGPIPAGMGLQAKRRFFADAHRALMVPETPEVGAVVEKLAAKIANLEARLAKVERLDSELADSLAGRA